MPRLVILRYVKVLVMGLGSSGTGAEAAKYYLKLGHEVAILESANDRDRSALTSIGAAFISREETLKKAGEFDLVVKLPGVPLPYEVKTKARKITNDIAALLENPATEHMTRIMIAGVKGKTMTAAALSNALTKLSVRNAFSEGVGFSAFHLLSAIDGGADFQAIILEMSKWHIRDTSEILGHKWPRIDYLGITDNLPLPLFPSDFSPEGNLVSGSWTQRIILPEGMMKRLLFAGTIKKNRMKGFPSWDNPHKGAGGLELSWEILREMGYSKKRIKGIFDGYKGIPNRMELVCSENGISFINDSSAVLPPSVPFSFRSLNTPYVHMIVGGDDKSGYDLSEMVETLGAVPSVTLLTGSLTDKLIPLLHREGIIFNGPCGDMDEAVGHAYSAALEHRGGREHLSEFILLSPGAYADKHYENEFERGQAFRASVRRLFHA